MCMCALLHTRNIADFLRDSKLHRFVKNGSVTDQQEALRKTNTERLGIMAAKTYDVGNDELETINRTA